MRRSEGERIRVAHTLTRLRSVLDGIEIGLGTRTQMDPSELQAIVSTASDLAISIAKMDAYERSERDSDKAPKVTPF